MTRWRILLLTLLPALLLIWAAAQALDPGAAAPTDISPALQPGPAQQERERWWQRLHWSTANCPREAFDDEASGVQRHPLTDGRALIEITCFLGAYQGQSLWYVQTPSETPAQLAFDQFDAPDGGVLEHYRDPALVGTVTVDADEGKLVVLRKYRGIGDCGQLLTYRLSDAEAKLVELRVRDCDDDAAYTPPERWPVVPLEGLSQADGSAGDAQGPVRGSPPRSR